MAHLSYVICFVVLCLVTYVYTQQCDQSSDVARFDCYPEGGPTQQTCEARKCCWRSPVQQLTLAAKHMSNIGNVTVPFCYYPSDFPTYEVTSNEPTDFGQRIHIVKSQTTYMPNDILSLTVDLIYETQQRFRIKIYDPANKRYEVPLQVPVVEKKADMTDYDVVVKSKPFSILVTRKSTGVTL
jgi:lysosomal alpha-glucosidase